MDVTRRRVSDLSQTSCHGLEECLLVVEGVIAIFLIIGLVWFWADCMRAKELALRVCVRACEQMHVQLLEQTVAFSRLALARDQGGQLCLRRWYGFEFSTDGGDRRRGSAALLGPAVELVRMEHPGGAVILGSGYDRIEPVR